MSFLTNGQMNTNQIGYASITVMLIVAFLFQALCFSFNNWYRIDTGIFVLRTGLWEMRIYDSKNVTGLDARNHEQAEVRFYNPRWKSAMDRIHKVGKMIPPTKKASAKGKLARPTQGAPRDRDPDIHSELTDMFSDPDYNEFEHMNFKTGENWKNLPEHIPDTVWDQMQSNIDVAEALYSIAWAGTFLLMCLFAFHQFLPWFQVTVGFMRAFCGALFVTAFLVFIAVLCYGNAWPPICKHITTSYEQSPNPKFADAARKSADCSFSLGYSLSMISALCLILTGIMTATRICQIQRGETFDLGGALNAAVSLGKSLLGRGNVGSTIGNSHTDQAWSQPPPTAYSAGYDQDGYKPTSSSQNNWERLE